MKMLLVVEGKLAPDNTSGEALAGVVSHVRGETAPYIQTLTELQASLTRHGFLLLNASLVFRSHVPPVKDAKAWQPFMHTVLKALAEHAAKAKGTPPTLVLWGKIAEQLKAFPLIQDFPKAVSEHPYNLSFIQNAVMQALFKPLHLLRRPEN
jgi:uracil-DNA glycosylase